MKDRNGIPSHVAIILDGNGRWATNRGKVRTYGHKIGAKNVKTIVKAAGRQGVKILTLYAFSTENWKRPAVEVNFLMRLFKDYLITQLRELIEDDVQVHIIGDMSLLSIGLRKEIEQCEKDTAHNRGLILNVAINYGGRSELVQAVKQISVETKAGLISPEQITEETISRHLYPSASSDVDLLIRTGGEFRISNFLLWQTSYSELYFTPVLWPDFDEKELNHAIAWYQDRDRRFGGLTGDGT